jgi:hypothetical protein
VRLFADLRQLGFLRQQDGTYTDLDCPARTGTS